MREETGIFVDAENHSDLRPLELNNELVRRGFRPIVEQHAYADWSNPCLNHTARRLAGAGFEMHHAWSGEHPGTYKNTADRYMQEGIFRTLYRRPKLFNLVVISGDEFFTDPTRELRQRGKRVVVAGDPLRMSKNLYQAADAYIPLGDIGRWILELDVLERKCEYVTFSYATQRLSIPPSDLSNMIRTRLVIQESVWRRGRGPRPEIWLNRRAYAVKIVLESIIPVLSFELAAIPKLDFTARCYLS